MQSLFTSFTLGDIYFWALITANLAAVSLSFFISLHNPTMLLMSAFINVLVQMSSCSCGSRTFLLLWLYQADADHGRVSVKLTQNVLSAFQTLRNTCGVFFFFSFLKQLILMPLGWRVWSNLIEARVFKSELRFVVFAQLLMCWSNYAAVVREASE